MKNYIHILLLIFSISIYANDVSTLPDVNINTQQELNNLHFIEEVGNLIIASEGVDQIIDLSNLSSIKNVRGSIYVINNNNLESLEGISVFVGGDVYIQRNKSLVKLAPGFVKGKIKNIQIKDNLLLNDINGFEQVESISSLTVEFNKSLKHMNGFASLKEITGDVVISNNDSLQYFKPFVDVVYFNGVLSVENNKSLYEADGLYRLYSTASKATVDGNTLFTTDLQKMKVVFEGGGRLVFTTQEELDAFGNSYKKKVFKGDIIIDKSSITNLDALLCLSEVDGKLLIKRNDKLVSIYGLSRLKTVYSLIISFNKRLNSLDGLENINSVKNNIVIYRNTFLTDASSLSDNVSLKGKLVIKSNPKLNR